MVEDIPYVAVPSGKCLECDRLLDNVMKSPDGGGFEELSLWVEHMNKVHHKKNG